MIDYTETERFLGNIRCGTSNQVLTKRCAKLETAVIRTSFLHNIVLHQIKNRAHFQTTLTSSNRPMLINSNADKNQLFRLKISISS